ncbi:bifunctional glutathione transferase/peroxidase [Saccharomycopsis crataegensis]|uniref:Bifunctional glutathione transferase/peroxidase n=1 Tax=Saccharomycopsis crataegensis TaxID=43959 RepID=A0AAV5QKP2_9ASCO|nr:bifunctional glutathione transferase/peroxidase [Saccharomycopsis crataegensis]
MSAFPKIKLHWLEKSRALRVIWLLEELGVKYEVIPYKRNENFRAPESLKKIHPLGKSPIVEFQQDENAKPIMLAESGHIFQWLLNKFDDGKLYDVKNREQIDYYLHYAEGTLQPPLLFEFIFHKAREAYAPWPISSLKNMIINKMSSGYSAGEVKTNLEFLEEELKKNNGYFVDGKLTGADIILSFPLTNEFGFEMKDYPNVSEWLSNIQKSKGYEAAKEIAKSYGSDY